MENMKMETFGSRLAYLIESKDMDASSRHTVPITAQKMIDAGVTKTDDPNSVAAVIRKHLKTAQACDVKMCYLIAYHDFFKCSYDFLMGEIDHPTHEKTDIHETTGLSDTAINNLIKLKDCDTAAGSPKRCRLPIINTLLSSVHFEGFLDGFKHLLHPDYRIPAYHTGKGKVVDGILYPDVKIPTDEHDYIKPPIDKYILTLLRDKDDITDDHPIDITDNFLESVAQHEIMTALNKIKSDPAAGL